MGPSNGSWWAWWIIAWWTRRSCSAWRSSSQIARSRRRPRRMDPWAIEVANLNYLADLADLVIRSSIIAVIVVLADLLLRKKPAAIQIWLWRLVVFSLLLLPITRVVVPVIPIPILRNPP